MSLHTPASAYAARPHDRYFTPSRHVQPLIDYARAIGLFPADHELWECAAGAGHVALALQQAGWRVHASDRFPPPITEQLLPVVEGDFLTSSGLSGGPFSIVTNPPYGQQSKLILAFLSHALRLMAPRLGGIALLLPFAFDSRQSRNDLVGEHPWFCGKITVAERIRWANLPQKQNGPNGHHAWYCWSSDSQVVRRARLMPQMVAK